MKIILFFLFIVLFQTYAVDSYSQQHKISVAASRMKLSQFFKVIEKQSNFMFFYVDSDIEGIDVDINVKDASVIAALNQALSKTGLAYEINGQYITILPARLTGKAQDIVVSGIVIDETGEPIPGANVTVKGTVTGVVTDVNGKYTITVPGKNSVIMFSFVGYATQELMVGEQKTINISLSEDTRQIEEVVVVGYGIQRKSDLTGSVVRADLSAMQSSPNVNLAQSLKGAVPGLNVGASTKAGDAPGVSIRGRNSISGTTSPLIVLDGIIYRGSLSDINPSDIESIDILKDASSAAIYGSQAANGVMLITTKTVQKISKPVIEYNGNFSFQKIMNGKIHRLDREEYLTQVEHADLSHSRLGPDLLQKDPNWDVTNLFIVKSVSDGYANGTDTDWWNLLTEDVPYIQNHNLSLRGKNELVSYFLSFGFLDQKNLIRNDTYKRYNLRVNIDAKVTDWMRLGTQSFFSSGNFSGANPAFSGMIQISPLTSPYDSQGDLIQLLDIGVTNPLVVFSNPDEEIRYNLTGNFYTDITIPFVKGLSYRLNYSRNLTINKNFNFDPHIKTMTVNMPGHWIIS